MLKTSFGGASYTKIPSRQFRRGNTAIGDLDLILVNLLSNAEAFMNTSNLKNESIHKIHKNRV